MQKFSTINQFCELAGVKSTWFREQVLHHHMFREYVYKPQKQFYIETEAALEALKEVFRDLEKVNV